MVLTEAPAEIRIPSATEDPAAYVDALLDALGDRDPLTILGTSPAKVRALCDQLTTADAARTQRPDEWSVEQTLGHLFDVDLVYGFRWRLALTEACPDYPGYDEKEWALLPRLPFWQSLNAWEGLRGANVALLRALPAAAFQRRGRHAEQGEETLELTVRKLAGHDLAHLNQIARTAWELHR